MLSRMMAASSTPCGAATWPVTYEIAIKELGYRPEPFAIADALMFADGKAIVDVRNITLRLTGATKEQVQTLWSKPAGAPRPESSRGALAQSSAPLAAL